MGTRTWSRKGVLTAAGKRRQTALGVNAIITSVSFDEPAPDAPRPINANVFAKGGAFESTLRTQLIDVIKSGVYGSRKPGQSNEEYIADLTTMPLSDLIEQDYKLSQALLYDAIGYNAPPTIESWEDVEAGKDLETFNGMPLYGYRGVYQGRMPPPDQDMKDWQVSQMTNDLRYGPTHFVGRGGTYGTFVALVPPTADWSRAAITTYTDPDKGKPVQPSKENRVRNAQIEAGVYALYDEDGFGVVTAMGLKRGARTNIVDFARDGEPFTSEKKIRAEFIKRYGFAPRTKENVGNSNQSYGFGFMASALGYDAVVQLGSSRGGSPHLVILNRGKMVVSSTDRLPEDVGATGSVDELS